MAAILVVDDDETLARLIASLLESAGYQTGVATNGREALQLFMYRTPDLVITDLMMPKMDGIALCRALQAEPRTRDIPIIMLAALASTADKVAALDAGVSVYLTKPFVDAELLAYVRRLLAQKQRVDELAARTHDRDGARN